MTKHLNITVKGRVIDVNFRQHTQKKARELGICGFILNQPPDAVYIEAEGQEPNLSNFLAWCRRGPMYAKVNSLQAAQGELKSFVGFEIRD